MMVDQTDTKSATNHETLARDILGLDYVSVQEAEHGCGFEYTQDQLDYFAASIPPQGLNQVQSLKRGGYALIPGPPQDLTLLGVRDLDSDSFLCTTGGWFAEPRHGFDNANSGVVAAGRWLVISKNPVIYTRYRSVQFTLRSRLFSIGFSTQSPRDPVDLIPVNTRMPNAAEMAYAVVVYNRIRNRRLLSDMLAYTPSTDGDDWPVAVGLFGRAQLDVRSTGGDSVQNQNIGIPFAW